MADQENPVFQIQRVYLKDLSLEQPNSPAILLEAEQPNVDIQIGVALFDGRFYFANGSHLYSCGMPELKAATAAPPSPARC